MNDTNFVLPSGRKLTLTTSTVNGDQRFVMSGGYSGSHSISADSDITTTDRLQAHWSGYVEVNARHEGHDIRTAPLTVEQPKKLSLKGPGGIIVTLDSAEVLVDGDRVNTGTVAMVFVPFKGRGTYWCVAEMGEVSVFISRRDIDGTLTCQQQAWLNSDKVRGTVEEFESYWAERVRVAKGLAA